MACFIEMVFIKKKNSVEKKKGSWWSSSRWQNWSWQIGYLMKRSSIWYYVLAYSDSGDTIVLCNSVLKIFWNDS